MKQVTDVQLYKKFLFRQISDGVPSKSPRPPAWVALAGVWVGKDGSDSVSRVTLRGKHIGNASYDKPQCNCFNLPVFTLNNELLNLQKRWGVLIFDF